MRGLPVIGADSAASTRAAAAARALERAGDATVRALRHLRRAAEVEWSGPGAAGYRAALDDVMRDLQRTHQQIGRAAAAMEQHAAAAAAHPLADLTPDALADGRLLDLAGLGPLARLAASAGHAGRARHDD
ncbi:hypothetical protein [Cellulomonas sp. ATA003]|uniref:hypothetical protein n=1 Tax=Cellulomonas sp. ATA003 TaxID=3073064 RepID=UPI0028738F29|nr:hypothetical protein [Cellulomonas sp. ATA003]WNB85689.1 hypothetical protein REH70_19635 [Cellulomonas sp. ATA003]